MTADSRSSASCRDTTRYRTLSRYSRETTQIHDIYTKESGSGACCVFIYWHSCESAQSVTKMLATYLSRFSSIADNKINCGPVLTWMEVSPNLLLPLPLASISYSPLRHDPPFSNFNISSALYIFKWSSTPKNSAPSADSAEWLQGRTPVGGVASWWASRCWRSVAGRAAASAAGTDSWHSQLTDSSISCL